jgi:hypothetical protein
MKYVLMLVLALFSASMAVEVPDSLVSADLRAKLDASAKVTNAKANAEVVRQYAGIGHEIGVAVNDAMSAITAQANQFANTEVGQMVKWIILYKILKGLVLGGVSIALTWIVILLMNIAMYIFYVRGKKDEKYGDNFRSDTTRGDLWITVMLLSFAIGIITTWITLACIT